MPATTEDAPGSATNASPELTHFLRLAINGRLRGASSGARAARKLALAILEDALILDGQAIDGLVEFIHRAKAAPETARDAIS